MTAPADTAPAPDNASTAPLKVLHVIVGLEIGGAELMLERLVDAQRRGGRVHPSVVSLTTTGPIGRSLQSIGVPVHALGSRSVHAAPRVVVNLFRHIRSVRPDVVQTWMYHSDLLGGIAAKLEGATPVVWGIRSSTPLRAISLSNMTALACAATSRVLPRVIVCNSDAGKRAHAAIGFPAGRIRVIPNGCDLTRFEASSALRAAARVRFGCPDDAVVIGTVGRMDPHKAYDTFVHAIGQVMRQDSRVRMLMAGRGLDPRNVQLQTWLSAAGVDKTRVVLAGEQDDPVPAFAALDVFCLSSVREGFPNVVMEAMAMELPCVVTDAGDARQIVGETGSVVPVGDVDGLATALSSLVNAAPCDRRAIGTRARRRVEARFSMDKAVAAFESVYEGLL